MLGIRCPRGAIAKHPLGQVTNGGRGPLRKTIVVGNTTPPGSLVLAQRGWSFLEPLEWLEHAVAVRPSSPQLSFRPSLIISRRC